MTLPNVYEDLTKGLIQIIWRAGRSRPFRRLFVFALLRKRNDANPAGAHISLYAQCRLLIAQQSLRAVYSLSEAVLECLVLLPRLDMVGNCGPDDFRDRTAFYSRHCFQSFGLLS